MGYIFSVSYPEPNSMPANKSAWTRYRVIDRCLTDKRQPFPSKAFLARRCGDVLGTDVSVSSIEKDIACMRRPSPEGLDAPIEYSRERKGFYYSDPAFSIRELNLTDEEWEGLRFASQLLHQYRDVPVFQDFKSAIDRIHTRFELDFGSVEHPLADRVQFEKPVDPDGQEWLTPLLSAIRQRRKVTYLYLNLYKEKLEEYELIPCLLREHDKKWYMVGWSDARKAFLTFALNRVIELEVLPGLARLPVPFDASRFFQHAIGITVLRSKPVKVVLEFLRPIHELVMIEPLHHSQQTIRRDEAHVRISLVVQLHDELYLRLMGYGPYVRVIRPLSLRHKLRDWYAQGLKNQGG